MKQKKTRCWWLGLIFLAIIAGVDIYLLNFCPKESWVMVTLLCVNILGLIPVAVCFAKPEKEE